MNRNSNFKAIIVLMSMFVSLQNISLMARSGGPFDEIQYNQVFDQSAIYKKYRSLMYKLGCADNVFKPHVDANSIAKKLDNSFDQEVFFNKNTVLPFDPMKDGKELAAFQKECMDRLNNSRRISLITPIVEGLSDTAFMAIILASLFKIKDFAPSAFGLNEMNFGNTVAGAVVTSLISLKGIAGAGYNLMFWPDNSLEHLENHFAINKCYIPQALWPKITSEFIAARQNLHNPERHTNFLNFASGFTVYKPKPALKFKDDMSTQDVKNELNARIDNFFADYRTNITVNYIKINVSKFIDSLTQDTTSTVVQGPRYVYLYGSGGIGKTHFVQTLSDWIAELIPNSVGFEEVVINSPIDLEGSENAPGTFLKALRHQLIQNKRGSVIMMDEATWLNQYVSSAKRIFNGDRSKLATSYFGSNIDGTGVSLEIPPMLIFVASNDHIEDPALASRFDTVLYPLPSQEALINSGVRVAANSNLLQESNCPVDKALITKWIDGLDQAHRNFRFVAGNIEAVLLLHNK